MERNTKPLEVANGCAWGLTVTSCVCVWPFEVVTNVAVVWGAALLLTFEVPEANPASAVVDPVDSPAVLPAVVVAEVDCPVTDVLEVGDDAGFDWGEEAGVLEGSVEGFTGCAVGVWALVVFAGVEIVVGVAADFVTVV